MLCPKCHGWGKVRKEPHLHRFGKGYDMEPCSECYGTGIVHCCEGLIEQKDDKPE